MGRLIMLIIFSVLMLNSFSAQAYVYFGGGVDFSFFHLRKLDKVIDKYNQTQGATLVSKLENVDYLMGPTAFFGNVSKNGFTFEISWKSSLKKIEAEYLQGGLNFKREIKIRYHEVGPGIGYTFTKLGAFRPGFLAFINGGTILELTRYGQASDIKNIDFTNVNRQFHLGFTLMAHLKIAGKKAPIGLSIRPYYHIGFLKIDHSELNQAIGNIKNNGSERYKDNNNYFGLQLAIIFKSKG